MPLCSIVMPVYNSSGTIKASIDSVIKQTCPDWELIVVDDCSVDSTPSIAAEYAVQDPRIRCIRMQSNSGGPAGPRNRGIADVKGRYIAFLDGDDVWYTNKLQKQLTEMQRNKWAISCTGYDVFKTGTKILGTTIPPAQTDYDGLLRGNTLGCLSVAYDSVILGKRSFPNCGHEDYALWLDILREGYLAYGIPEPLCAYRLTPGSVSRNKLRVLGYFYNIYRHRQDFSVVSSVFMTGRYALLNATKYKNAKRKAIGRAGR